MSEIFNRAKSFGNSVVNHLADGMKQATEEEYNKRISICHKCDKYEAGPNRCGQCGCFLKVKAAWNSEKCPLDKW
jgi:Family of unknown function (DUF6171)